MQQLPPCCPVCRAQFAKFGRATKTYTYEGNKFCSRTCLEAAVTHEVNERVFVAPRLMKFPPPR